MHILKLRIGFDLHHHTLNDKINPLFTHVDVPVDYINPDLTTKLQPLRLQL